MGDTMAHPSNENQQTPQETEQYNDTYRRLWAGCTFEIQSGKLSPEKARELEKCLEEFATSMQGAGEPQRSDDFTTPQQNVPPRRRRRRRPYVFTHPNNQTGTPRRKRRRTETTVAPSPPPSLVPSASFEYYGDDEKEPER